jgi:hypothetical protein
MTPANHPGAGKAGIASQLANERTCAGLPDPARSAYDGLRPH